MTNIIKGMSKRSSHFKDLYKWLLPIHPVTLPELIPHNPLSWIYFTYAYFTSTVSINTIHITYKDGMFVVSAPAEMKRLWCEGFFGKGVLSRSEATWFDRTSKRLGLGEFKNLTREEITALRREERKKFKKERAKLEAMQAELKKQGKVDPFVEEKLRVRELRDKELDVKDIKRETYIREEDSELLIDGKLTPLEFMELQPVEVFFLQFALGVVEVSKDGSVLSTEELFQLLTGDGGLTPSNPFLIQYIVYHYYRSSGWCARSGVKFGTDLLLYKRGPPLTHAEFAISIIPTSQTDMKFNEENAMNFIELSTISRIIGQVRKKLILTFVEIPSLENLTKAKDIKDILELYKVQEFMYRRFVPNRNRD
ncbi:hypothetical protein WICPIJ_003915 [Wickerhamomyces pijperi]|uniref:tRNA-splicing endonuclease subunit Sen2 n=1 Tax=Wickerhamomyces pijperi TaxID=599730 RepID=A0A9P8Q6N1_WICPI|nr:hypothetical protein WICPIJ_003915 [Wickerhamomyces pijperi]